MSIKSEMILSGCMILSFSLTILLAIYVMQGGPYNGSTSNLLPDPFSTFSQSSGHCNAQLGSSGVSELYESYQSSFSSGSVEEVSSKFVGGENNTDRVDAMDRSGEPGSSSFPEVNQALRKLTAQLSLGDDNDLVYLEKLPPDYSQNGTPQVSDLLVHESKVSKHDSLISLPSWEHDQWSVGNNGVQDHLKKGILSSYLNEANCWKFLDVYISLVHEDSFLHIVTAKFINRMEMH